MPYIGNNHIAGDHTNNFKVLDDISSYTATFDGSATSVVDTTNNTIRVVEHRFIQGQRVTYTNGGGGNIGGLTTGTAYFIIHDSSSTFKLATSASNAATSTAINLSSVGSGSSHTINAAFDGVNTKFKLTHGTGTGARLNNATQINVAINNVLQRPNLDPNNFTDGFALEDNHKIVFQTAPTSEDIFWGSIIANTLTTFDISDHKIDTFTGDGTTTEFNLSHVPANNESLMVSINGVLQHPSNASTTRSYTLIANVLQFTAAPANGDEIQVRHIGFAGSSTSDVTGFYGRTGNVVLGSTDHITTGDITARNINAGIVTATSFDGTFSSNIGGSNANFTGIVTAGTFKGGNIDAVDGAFSGNVTIGGTLTYEDVTNIDAVGIITAREGIHIPDNKRLDFGGTAGDGDFEIRHTSGNTFIENNTGSFFISQSGNATSNPLVIHGGSELQLKHYYSNGGQLFALKSVRGYQTEIYYQGAKKIETTAKGILVGTGVTIETNGQANFAGITTVSGTDFVVKPPSVSSSRIKLGYAEQMKISVSSSNQNVIQSTAAYLQIASNNLLFSRSDTNLTMASFKAGQQCKLGYNYVDRIATSGIGATVYGQLDTTNLTIAGVTTMSGALNANGNIVITSATPYITFDDTNNRNWQLNADGGNFIIKDTTDSVNRFYINSTGNAFFSNDLDVDGHTNLDNVSIAGVTTFTNSYVDFKPGNGGNAHFRILSTGSGDAGIFFDAANGDIAGSDYVFIGQKNNLDFVINPNVNAGNIDFQRAGNTQLRIDSTGKLLIGTTIEGNATGDDLTISNAGNMGLTLRSTNSSYCNIYFSDATSGTAEYEGYISYNHATNSLEFATVHTERLRIDSSGQIGIGNIAPDTWSTGHGLTIGTSQATLWGVSDQINLSGNAYFNSGWKAAATKAGASQIQQSLGKIDFRVTGSVNADAAITWIDAVSILNTGAIVKGTSSTVYDVDIVGTEKTVEIGVENNSSAYRVALNTTNNVNADFNIQHKANLTSIGTGVNVPLCFHINGGTNAVSAEKMRLTADLLNIKGGNLHVGQDGATGNFTDSNNGNTKHIEIGATGGGDALLTTHASGYGIGYFGYEAGGDRLVIACDNGGGNNKIDFITDAGTSTGGSTDNLNAKVPKMRIEAGGDVAINNTDPKAKLDVRGNVIIADDIGSVPSTFPPADTQLLVYTSTNGQPITNTNCARLCIATDAKQVGAQGYNGAIDFGNSDATASGDNNQYNYRVASIMSNAAGDTGTGGYADGDLQFWTKSSSGNLTQNFRIGQDGKLYKGGNQFYPLVNYTEVTTYNNAATSSSSYTDLRVVYSNYTPKKAGNRIVIHHQSQMWNGASGQGNGDVFWRIMRDEGSGYSAFVTNERILGNHDGWNNSGGYSGLARHHRTVHLMGSFVCNGNTFNLKTQGRSMGVLWDWYHDGNNILQIWEYDIS